MDLNTVSAMTKYVVISITRCSSKDNLDSCASFKNLKFNDFCPILKQKNNILSSVVYAFHPPAICPFEKGHYVEVNGTYDPNLVQFFPMDSWYWKAKVDMYEKKEFILSMCVEGQIVPYYF